MHKGSSRSAQGRALGGQIAANRAPVDYFAQSPVEEAAQIRRALESLDAAPSDANARTHRENAKRRRQLAARLDELERDPEVIRQAALALPTTNPTRTD